MGQAYDKLVLALRYRRRLGRFPNLSAPARFTEKQQLAKLTWRDPRMPILTDKIMAKEFVADKLGAAWVTPNYFTGSHLPEASRRCWPPPYAIKVNHRSGKNIFVLPAKNGRLRFTDRHGLEIFPPQPAENIDWHEVDASVEKWLANRHGRHLREWAYAEIDPRVLVEPFLGNNAPPLDYKLMIFDGRVEFILLQTDRFGPMKSVIHDRDWNRMPFNIRWEREERAQPRPETLTEMIEGAEILAAGFPFMQVDLYEVGGAPRFGEVTFHPLSGFEPLVPDEWDERLGALWPNRLPTG